MAEDKLRKRCQALLDPVEHIELEAEASVKRGYLSEFGAYLAYLTGTRLICLRRATPVFRRLLFWIPEVVTIRLSSIDRIGVATELTRSWLHIDTNGTTYKIRVGQGPYPMLRDTPGTAKEWLAAIEARRVDPTIR